LCRPENDGAFLFSPDTGQLAYINRTALECHRLIDGEKDLGAILGIFRQRYPKVDALQLQTDIQACLDSFSGFDPPAASQPAAGDSGILRYSLDSLYIYLADRCNLRCGHCWISPSAAGSATAWLDPAVFAKAIADAMPLGLGSVKFTGGEPLLYPDWKSLVSSSVDRGLDVVLETNGTLIDAAAADLLKRMNVFVSISLDGAKAESHDLLRGVSGAYAKTLHGMACLAEKGIPYQIIMTLQKQNCSQIPAILALADRWKAGSVKINPLIPCGRGAAVFEMGNNLALDQLLQLYADTQLEAAAFPDLDVFFDLPPALLGVADLTGSGLHQCRILNILGILANGNISICGIGQGHPSLRMGHVSHDTIADIWQTHPLLEKLRDALPKRLQPPCDTCIFQFQCMGGCRALAFACDGDLLAPFFICREMHAAGRFPVSRQFHRECPNGTHR